MTRSSLTGASRRDLAWLWWRGRSPREQVMVAVMGVAIAAVLIWYGLLAPLAQAAQTARARAATAATQAAALAALTTGSAAAAPAAADGRGLTAVVEAAAGPAGIGLDRRREDADGRLKVWTGAAEPKRLMAWIVALEQQRGVTVVEFTAVRRDNGALEAEITFAPAGR